MIFLRGLVAGIFAIMINFILSKYNSFVILYVPKFKKKYIYEELDENYKSYLIIYYLIVWLIYLVLFLISMNMFELARLSVGINIGNLISIRREYWIFPAIILSMHLSNILARRLFQAILEKSYDEFMIYMFCKRKCFNLRDMVINVYFKSKIYKVYYKIIIVILTLYIFLGMLYYSNINPQNITINKYFSIAEKQYSYRDVAFIFEQYTWKEHKFMVIFKDGTCWRSSGLLINNNSEEDYKLMNLIEEKSKVKAIELK